MPFSKTLSKHIDMKLFATRTSILSFGLSALAWAGAAAASPRSQDPANAKFEEGEAGKPPPGWSIVSAGYTATLSAEGAAEGKMCCVIARDLGAKPGESAPFGYLLQEIDAATWRGKRIRISARLKMDEGSPADFVAMLVRVELPRNEIGFFDNMAGKGVHVADWREVATLADVDAAAAKITVGFMLQGSNTKARAFVDGVALVASGKIGEGDQPAAPLGSRGTENLTALARLFGYVRFFHPASGLEDVDWDQFLIAAIERVENAAGPEELAAALQDAFEKVAPSVSVWSGAKKPMADPAPPALADGTMAWRHQGVQLAKPQPGMPAIYSSRRVRESLDRPADKRQTPPPGTAVDEVLAPGVWCHVPVTMYATGSDTLPRRDAKASPRMPDRPEGWLPSGRDRTTRLAGVIFAWNVMQHFFPYFDVVKTDWAAALSPALGKAATDADMEAYLDTLRQLIAALHDGHGGVYHATSQARWQPPVAWTFAGEQLVITDASLPGGEGAQRGDVVLAIDGKPVAWWLDLARKRISAATPGWFRCCASDVIAGEAAKREKIELDVLHLDGSKATLTLARSPAGGGMAGKRTAERRPDDGAELAPGIVYMNLDGATNASLAKVKDQLVAAKGIVFDLRGYPADAAVTVIRMLTDETIHSAQWWVPSVVLPDRKDLKFTRTPSWTLPPKEPRLTANVAFVTDGRAISYAESCMGIVEHYRLGEIVGATTAGTNGNVNPLPLPGGIMITWTGMRVLKQDGSTHHGVGIAPTVPVTPTQKGIAEGRDEVLEKAVEVVRAKLK